MSFSYTVLQVIPALDAGGAERTTAEIARAVTSAGGRALVASRGGRLAADIEAAGGQIFRMPVHSKNPLTMLANRRRLLRLIREEKVDIVHARSRAPAWSALWAARAAGVPFVTTYHGAYGAKTALKRFYNSAMVRADAVIANSEFTKRAICAQYAVDSEKLTAIPRGADFDQFDPAKVSLDQIAALAAAWGLDPSERRLRVLLPARLTDWKGHVTAIEAGARLARRLETASSASGQPIVLRIVFAGEAGRRRGYETALRERIAERGVRDMIKLVGHCADMPAAYGWADVVVAPSTRPEAFGRVAVEAAAMGRPVIAAGHGGARETVVDGETGLLIPPGDAPALADALGKLAEDAGMRAKMGARALQRARRLYSIEAMCAATLGVYEKAARKTRSAA
ncbi:MAG: glycosyltransferase family 4 protein [Parvularculaceae bacterium]